MKENLEGIAICAWKLLVSKKETKMDEEMGERIKTCMYKCDGYQKSRICYIAMEIK